MCVCVRVIVQFGHQGRLSPLRRPFIPYAVDAISPNNPVYTKRLYMLA